MSIEIRRKDTLSIKNCFTMSNSVIISDKFVLVAKKPCFRDRWISHELWLRLIKVEFPSLDSILKGGINFGSLNKGLTKHYVNMLDDFTVSNTVGIFRRKYKHYCEFDQKRRNFTYNYVTDPCNIIPRPPENAIFTVRENDLCIHPIRGARNGEEVADKHERAVVEDIGGSKEDQGQEIDVANSESTKLRVSSNYWNSGDGRKLFSNGFYK